MFQAFLYKPLFTKANGYYASAKTMPNENFNDNYLLLFKYWKVLQFADLWIIMLANCERKY
jgi:hypothetical protein